MAFVLQSTICLRCLAFSSRYCLWLSSTFCPLLSILLISLSLSGSPTFASFNCWIRSSVHLTFFSCSTPSFNFVDTSWANLLSSLWISFSLSSDFLSSSIVTFCFFSFSCNFLTKSIAQSTIIWCSTAFCNSEVFSCRYCLSLSSNSFPVLRDFFIDSNLAGSPNLASSNCRTICRGDLFSLSVIN